VNQTSICFMTRRILNKSNLSTISLIIHEQSGFNNLTKLTGGSGGQEWRGDLKEETMNISKGILRWDFLDEDFAVRSIQSPPRIRDFYFLTFHLSSIQFSQRSFSISWILIFDESIGHTFICILLADDFHFR
jgi:hypothetical protein